jgi:N-acetylmuramoyl-L-alanine amidase
MKTSSLITAILMLLVGCASTMKTDSALAINSSKSAKGHTSRAQYLILHYTALDLPTSLKVLTQQRVSSHYLVGDDTPVTIFQLVDENRQALHAGISEWRGHSYLGPSSIGIEIVNPGYSDTPEGRIYPPYQPEQIERVVLLVKEIVARHKIKPAHILGHNEIAPQRKSDPGPMFPWKRLADEGLIPWPDAAQVSAMQAQFEQQLPEIRWFQQRLQKHGYTTPQTGVLDSATRNVLSVFQTRYRPEKFDGAADAQTAALLEVLTH